jgi:RNA polymerase sigma-70 factor (family 1)
VLRQLQDYSVLTAIAQGDERAFSRLFHEYHQPLGRFIFSVTRSHELTEDIVMDVFVKLWQNRSALPAIDDFSAYLFIITRNHTLNAIRKLNVDRQKQLAVHREIALEAQPDPRQEEDFDRLLEHAVDRLPQQQRKVYLLKQQGFKNADVAYRLDISVNSVKKYQQWALQAIARFIKTGPFSGFICLLTNFF